MPRDVFIASIIMIGCTVAANVLMKLGANAPSSEQLFGLLHWKTIGGFFAFGLAALAYAWLLKLVPLNVAQSLTAAQFAAVLLASRLVFGEVIPPTRWVGIALILGGILLVGSSAGFGKSA